MRRGLLTLVLLALVAPAQARAERRVEVLVTLDAPPLAHAISASRVLSLAARRSRLEVGSPTSVAYLRSLAVEQRAVTARIRRAIPSARVRRRYRIVLNALAAVVPESALPRLRSLAGVHRVDASVRYRAQLDRSPAAIGAPALWGPTFSTAGNGIKIGILDDGIDRTHPFFDPRGYAMPPGYPKGNRGFTSAKVIVARAFPPRAPSWRYARRPFDPRHSFHGTHVAGIAAGNAGVFRGASPRRMSGVAPRAYLGNYKVLTIPTASGIGLDGNAPEIVAGIEAAVRDGMDVINLSLGQPEIEPRSDVVARALDGAAEAGVVPVTAAGNDFTDFGVGSIASPGTAVRAITVGAWGGGGRGGGVLRFSASGPTAISQRLKPDVVAPGGAILSSVPRRKGTWAEFDGTNMAAPHVAGAAALLRQRHPAWTVSQLKSALVATAQPLGETLRAGGGVVDLARAAEPTVFVAPSTLSFGLLRRGARATRRISVTDAGGGVGTWAVRVVGRPLRGVTVAAPEIVTVPRAFSVRVTVGRRAAQGDYTGFVTLTRVGASGVVRRVPFWVGISAPQLGRHRTRPLTRPGTYRGNTAGQPALVASYRYPTGGGGTYVRLPGPEQVFRVRVRRPLANFGVVLLSRGRGVRVQARVVTAGDENRLVGYASLPFNLNPYLESFLEPRAVAGAIRPRPGSYDVVFDSRTRASAGAFRFRFWVDDTTPPRARLLTRAVRRGSDLVLAASDRGSGIDPGSLVARVDGRRRVARVAGGRIRVDLRGVATGRHRLVLQVSDYQETRNTENVGRILPNTRRLSVVFSVR